MSPFCAIAGVGSALPARIVRNADLPAELEADDAWIVSRTGIKQRHLADAGILSSDLAIIAARHAMHAAGWSAVDIDAIIVATTTPDDTFPATATRVQAALGCRAIAAFDLQAVCAGFVYGLGVADSLIRARSANRVLLIGAEVMSRIVDWTDRGTCVLFGDGAGAMALAASPTPGIGPVVLASDGQMRDALYVDGGPGRGPAVGHLRMQGREVFRHAVDNMCSAMQQAAARAEVDLADLDWVVPHQANQRILDAVAKRLDLDPRKVISTVAQHANTSAASVPLAFAQGVADGRIQRGQTLMLAAMGGGFTWGAAVVRY